MQKKIILDLCGGTGSFSQFYAQDDNYEVKIIDPQVWKGGIDGSGDVRFVVKFDDPIHGIIAAPPCTIFANSGARWWAGRSEQEKLDGISVMDACLRIAWAHRDTLKWWVLENPVGKMKQFLGDPTMSFQPNEYAGYSDNPRENQYTKKTLLWGDFKIPPKKELPPVDGSKLWKNYGGKSDRTKMMRSMTPDGFAKAFYLHNK